jgi:cobalt-zinc-cadmium efflux system outer membrane protein
LRAAESRCAAAEQAQTAAREVYRLARIGYEAGRMPLDELSSTRRALTEAQTRALDARVARVTAAASLARLTGRVPFAE